MFVLLLLTECMSQVISYPPYPASQQIFPPECNGQSQFPSSELATLKNYYDANRPIDPCEPRPLATRPAIGQQVYLQDPLNFCIVLPNPYAKSIADIYNSGNKPTIVQGEGYLQSYCLGSYLTPGAWPLPTGAIKSARVLTGRINNQNYIQISGKMNCDALNMNCVSADYSDGGQYDTAPYINFGKSPFSGVDTSKNVNMPVYNMQAGNGIFCMRVCEAGPSGGMQLEDPCNVKNDTAGCHYTMNITTFELEGFEMGGRLYPTPPQVPDRTLYQVTTASNGNSAAATGITTSGTAGESSGTNSNDKKNSATKASSFFMSVLALLL